MSGPRILFVVDAGPGVGGGHLVRSLALAQALAARGATPIFLSTPPVEEALRILAPGTPRISAPSGGPPGLIAAAAFAEAEAVAFDHFGLSREAHAAIGRGRPRLVVDELANRPLGAELVVDDTPGRPLAAYAQLAPEARVLIGPQYAALRPEFSGLREAALMRREGPVRRVLVALGLTDPEGLAGLVVSKLRARFGGLAIDIVLGADAASRGGLERLAGRDARLSVHVETPDMGMLMAEADIAVGAAGTSAWERCALALPSVAIAISDNQRARATALAETGAALVVDRASATFEADLERAIVRLAASAGLRTRLAQTGAGLCDGLGGLRLADALLGLIGARDSLPHSQTQEA
ncbi:MAG: UDP-2,4-diacetamido-2,4,6-trideoxy-beta-L-altropyranose hydrolase [Phenylobacterium sp.]